MRLVLSRRDGFIPFDVNVTLATTNVNRDIVLTRKDSLAQLATLTLQVKGATLRGLTIPLSGAQIVMNGPSGQRVGRTDAYGRYSIQLPAGNYAIKVMHTAEYRAGGLEVTIGHSPVTREVILMRTQMR